jgi:hypothetical protein
MQVGVDGVGELLAARTGARERRLQGTRADHAIEDKALGQTDQVRAGRHGIQGSQGVQQTFGE